MLKRVATAIGRWLSPNSGGAHQSFSPTRRGFFRKAGLGAASAAGVAALAKTAADALPEQGSGELYHQTNRAGEQELLERDYVLMSEQEKAEMIRGFTNTYDRDS